MLHTLVAAAVMLVSGAAVAQSGAPVRIDFDPDEIVVERQGLDVEPIDARRQTRAPRS